MHQHTHLRTCGVLLAILLALFVIPSTADAASPAQRCEAGMASAAAGCVARVNALTRRCYARTGAACAPGDPAVARALAGLERTVLSRCAPDAVAQAAGFGAQVTTASVLDRVREACLGEAATIAARTFGGPQATLLDGAAPADAACLDVAFAESGKLLVAAFRAQGACIRKAHAGGSCNAVAVGNKVASLEQKAAATIAKKCASLDALLHVSPQQHAARATAQAQCLTATAHGDAGPLDLRCGPRAGVPVPARGQWVKVTLDESTYGTRCGDGSPYAFWLRLAPSGSPLTRVVTDMQGGGVCLFESDCSTTNPGLFKADEGQPGGGYLSTSASVNPFNDWTMVFMPYCTQDLHVGGGVTQAFSSITVHRYGAVNARAALRYVRDVLWAATEAEDPEGWHPDRLRVMFAGESAGGYGVMYNYHDVLDELRWVNTTAVPDSGLALGPGLAALAGLYGAPTGWNMLQMLPSYCTASDCGSGPVIEAATSPRLEATPAQRILNLSNQVDSTQSSTTLFPNLNAWINALRTDYCDERGQAGIHFFLPANTSSIHTMLRSDNQFTNLAAQGVTVRDYVSGVMADPTTARDRVDEGSLVSARPGVNPFACALPAP